MSNGTLCDLLDIEVPIIGGAMYPCSNPELVAAVSAAGGIGVVQPMSLTYVHGHDFREGLRLIRELSGGKPIGLNLIIEASSQTYLRRIENWANIALEEGVAFFVTALGDPRWIVDMAGKADRRPVIFHDVTQARHAEKAKDAGVDGFIAVNDRAGGHAGTLSPEALYAELEPFGLPIVGAGGVGDRAGVEAMLAIGYAGVQLGTRFIATEECTAHDNYKQAIIDAAADDIVLTERLTGVPVAIINTPTVQRTGTRAGPIARWMLKGRRTKHWMRTIYSLQSIWKLKKAAGEGGGYQDYWQAGRSAGSVHAVRPVSEIIDDLAGC
ncbi:MAG: 2-nitropropane dioxygenase [Gammaproteobacteria bacterium]|nr:MAG: 2-nitropropane dioxygenase [Gammaproteobacteria bacterium]